VAATPSAPTPTAAGLATVYTLDLASSLPQVLSEDSDTTFADYVYGIGPLEQEREGTTYWYLTDTLGSVRLVTDSVGASPATYAYSAFGSTRKSSGAIANEVRFTGERTDTESGLEFLRARTYDPSTGTFLQRDSWGITATNSQSIDAYVYTANNPINAIDPSGHSAREARRRPVRRVLSAYQHSAPPGLSGPRRRQDREGATNVDALRVGLPWFGSCPGSASRCILTLLG
jgi:RHS repeat-associated protein